MRTKGLILAVIFLLGTLALNAVVQAQELPNFNKWVLIRSLLKDIDKDGVDDVAIKFLNDNLNPKKSLNALFLFSFRPIDQKRIDLAILLQFIRSSEPNKDTITSVRFLFFARENEKLVFIEERIIHRPKVVQDVIMEPMFDENSLFGKRYVNKWREIGIPIEIIIGDIPKWGWMPEN